MLQEVRCPTCRQLTPLAGNPYRPFCSERCKLRDLGNWASERYRVPAGPVDEGSEDPRTDDGDESE